MSTTSRLGTAFMYDNAVRNIGSRQASLTELQEKLTSGTRVLRASDDPVAAAQAERALTRLERIKTDQRALETQRNNMALAESTLREAGGLMQEARDLIVRAGSPTLSAADRKTIAGQLTGLKDQLVTAANRKDTNGIPVLSALGSALTPFAEPSSTSSGYQFQGLPGQAGSSSVSVPQALNGDTTFMFEPLRDGAYVASVTMPNNATNRTVTTSVVALNRANLDLNDPNAVAAAGKNYRVEINSIATDAETRKTQVSYKIFDMSDRQNPVELLPATPPPSTFTATATTSVTNQTTTLSIEQVPGIRFEITGQPSAGDLIELKPATSVFDVLDTAIQGINENSGNAITQAVGQALGNLDKGLEQVSTARSLAGGFLNRVDRIMGTQDDRALQLEADRSRAQDLDMIKGISDFQNQQTAYSAALQSYAQIQKLSLFNFIG